MQSDKLDPKLWPLEIEDPHGMFPKSEAKQRHAINVYKVYMARYEKTYDKGDAMEFTSHKFAMTKANIRWSLDFTRAVIKALKEQEEQAK